VFSRLGAGGRDIEIAERHLRLGDHLSHRAAGEALLNGAT